VRRNGLHGLIVDFGGVLTSPLGAAIDAFCESEQIERAALMGLIEQAYGGRHEAVIARAERGELTPPELDVAVAAALGTPSGAEGLTQRLLGRLTWNADMARLVNAVRAGGIRTALLSNTWGPLPIARERYEPLFDACVLSHEAGVRKPDASAFELAAERLGLRPTDCAFVDDFVSNVDGARRAGLTAHLHREVEETAAWLGAVLDVRL
jgi:putative hydrolase of the HAD superfamily